MEQYAVSFLKRISMAFGMLEWQYINSDCVVLDDRLQQHCLLSINADLQSSLYLGNSCSSQFTFASNVYCLYACCRLC